MHTIMDRDSQEAKETERRLLIQAQKYENREVAIADYEPNFKKDYVTIYKKIYFLLRLTYSLSPLNRDNRRDVDKLKNIVKNLVKIENNVRDTLLPQVDRMQDVDKKQFHKKAIEEVDAIIKYSENKVLKNYKQ